MDNEIYTRWQDKLNHSLIEAIRSNDFPRIKILLSRGSDPNYVDKYKMTPLEYAIDNAIDNKTPDNIPLEIVRYLLSRGANFSNYERYRTLNQVGLSIYQLDDPELTQMFNQFLNSIFYPRTKILIQGDSCPNWTEFRATGKSGTYGDTFIACCSSFRDGSISAEAANRSCNYILKYVPILDGKHNKWQYEDFKYEVDFQNRCADAGLCAFVYEAWLAPRGGVMIMDRFDLTLHELIEKYPSLDVWRHIADQVILLFKGLHSIGLQHNDAHTKNIMVKANYVPTERELRLARISGNPLEKEYALYDYSYYFIDMGSATEIPDHLITDQNDRYKNNCGEYLDFLYRMIDRLETVAFKLSLPKSMINEIKIDISKKFNVTHAKCLQHK